MEDPTDIKVTIRTVHQFGKPFKIRLVSFVEAEWYTYAKEHWNKIREELNKKYYESRN